MSGEGKIDGETFSAGRQFLYSLREVYSLTGKAKIILTAENEGGQV
ncbi:MAG: hypothetical protein ACLRSW_13975 [Christensenellaceae bacterium]